MTKSTNLPFPTGRCACSVDHDTSKWRAPRSSELVEQVVSAVKTVIYNCLNKRSGPLSEICHGQKMQSITKKKK